MVTIPVVCLTLLFLATNVFAHNGWSQTNSPIVEKGQHSYVELLFGNHSDDHTSYRIDRKWDLNDSEVKVTSPSLEEQTITDSFFYLGEEKEVDAERLGVNNYYAGSFQAIEEGIYIISAEGDFTYGDEEEPTLRSAKSFVAVSDCPQIANVRDYKGYDVHVTPERAEIVPFFNPAVMTPDQSVTAQVLLKGEPVADAEVAVIRRSDSSDLRLKTDENGKFTWETGEAEYYLIRVELEGNEDEYEATMTYTVQEG
ncbi:DUF4198 domain-containing protein [Alteribacter populi]|uniref:DUF4198 domain-containing protein n=1 Tax=Alteribacter populi TaxID=2011011 RepID=UPI001E371F18|nr:DUF4198 domain-containing protein [Alteribacter populi]